MPGSPSYAYQKEQTGTSYFTGSELTFVPFSHYNLTQKSWLEKLKTPRDSWKYAPVLTPFWIWRTLNEVCSSFTCESKHLICIRWWSSPEESNRGLTQMKKWKNSIPPISWWHWCREPHYERLSRNSSTIFSSTLFESISGSEGKAAWGAYLRFMSLSLSQDKDKKPQEKFAESMSMPVSISEAD